MKTTDLNRRTFILNVALGTVISRVAGVCNSIPVAAQAEPRFGDAILRLRLSDYPALQQDFGSIRVGTTPQSGTEPAGFLYPIVINRAPGGIFHALSSRCPHAGCTVNPLDPEALKISCPCHFSQFEIDGSYISGPANGPLTRYRTSVVGEFLLVEIPEMPFTLTVERASVQGNRLAIQFLAFGLITYEVHFRAGIGDVPSRVNFALTETGPFDQTELPGSNDDARVYVPITPGQAGIYSIAMQTQLV